MTLVWWRRDKSEPRTLDESFGVGVQVHVIDDERQGSKGWVGDPTGVIIASASTLAHGAFEVEALSGRVWTIAFDEPQYRADGTGPVSRADIPEYLLMTAPPADTADESDS
ncbi:hypothetical protein HII28_03325 [Planctomonas sp. JC2975]|uniref:hypothetical protein n=1 Tax=Planctomonas sp. JC2975 TaxID=2729626 RepID=UPI0014729612|nr:hypothetical protein [Planctomonas sp. JC2975]NNC10910.1 hypothetical protein [Planctomonas sp. JC2975]